MQDWKITDLNLPNLKFDGTAVKPLPLHINQQLVNLPTELVVVVDCAANVLKCLQHVSRW